ncbi:MAG: extracellular solute-binding protein [Oscillospiraceae bacterium]|nr:extracellular solute-binding protein [Oscillospiraceae bacterium]
MKKILLALLAAAAMLPAPFLASCSQQNETGGNDGFKNDAASPDDISNGRDAPETHEEYEFPDIVYDGSDFSILNVKPIWGYTPTILVEEQIGDFLNDAIYMRNIAIEEKFGINLKETSFEMSEIEKKIRTVIMAGDDSYDVMYCPISNGTAFGIGFFAADGLLYNLFDIPELQLEKEWWDKTALKEGKIGSGNEMYFAMSDINLYAMQSPICMFFNENMIKNIGLDLPYNAVKNGKWTLDEFHKYSKAGAALNGDDSFDFSQSGNSIYGYTTWGEGVSAMIIGAGEKYISADDEKAPYLAIENGRFYNVCDKIADMLHAPGEFEYANSSAEHHYEAIFRSGRALFMTAELKAADGLREFDDTFGIVPMPKYDSNQDSYHTMFSRESPAAIIPVTNADPSKAGVIMDAMAYLSHRDVTPAFFDVTMSQKRLRNEESIDMLKIVRDTKFFNVGLAYGWINGGELYGEISMSVSGGNGAIASIIEKYKDSVKTKIDATMNAMKN